MNHSKYKLAICVLFDPVLHGITEQSDKNICKHLLIHHTIEPHTFLNYYYHAQELLTFIKYYYNNIIIIPHPIIRNYENIVNSQEYFKIDIIQEDILDGQEYVGYLKTFWLKLLQRKWKKFFKDREKKIRKMCNPKRLIKREITGK